MPQHANLSEAELHELKGASTAAASTVPVANGSGSTVFAKLTTASIDTTSIFDANKYVLEATLADISTASNFKIVIPKASTLTKVWTCLQGAITGADAAITVTNHAGSTATTFTVAFTGSAAGDVDSGTPSSNNTFSAGQVCTVATDGASTGTVQLYIVLELTQTA